VGVEGGKRKEGEGRGGDSSVDLAIYEVPK
jgi:hypothetical protein